MSFEEDELSKYEMIGVVNRQVVAELAKLKLAVHELEETCIERFGFDGQYHPESYYGDEQAAYFIPDPAYDSRHPSYPPPRGYGSRHPPSRSSHRRNDGYAYPSRDDGYGYGPPRDGYGPPRDGYGPPRDPYYERESHGEHRPRSSKSKSKSKSKKSKSK